MGLFDSYFDPDQFQDSGGLLGRLLSLQRTGDGQPSSMSQMSAYSPVANVSQDLNSRYQALRPILGERNAMLAIVHPEAGRALIAQVLARRKDAGDSGDTNCAGQTTAPAETSKNCQCGGCAARAKN